MKKLLSFFPFLFLFSVFGNAQHDFISIAQPGKCYAQCIYKDKYLDETKQIFEYTGNDFKAKGVKRKVIELSPARTRWERRKPAPNCISYPEDCMPREECKTMFLVDISAKTETYYVVKDTTVNKEFILTEIPIKILERVGGRSGWAEVLCEKDINTTIIQNVNQQLIDLDYLDESLLEDTETLGMETKKAIRNYQEAQGLPIGGKLNIPTLKHLDLY